MVTATGVEPRRAFATLGSVKRILVGAVAVLVFGCGSTVVVEGSHADGGGSGGAAGAGSGATSGSGGSGGTSGAGSGGAAGAGGSSATGGCSACAPPTSACDHDVCVEPNCVGLARDCGTDRSCCESAAIQGETLAMGRGDTGPDAFPAGSPDEQPEHNARPLAVRLDAFEVTVGRFRRFLDAFAPPAAGAGAHPGIPGSGWQESWSPLLGAEAYEVVIGLQCGFRSTWSDDPSGVETHPMNCVSWYAAFAFCAWDGGFLPTEAEWEAAAAGGADNRLYPWGADAPSKALAGYDCRYGALSACEFDDIPAVFSLSGGVGKYGHLGLAGGVREWTLDAYDPQYYASDCLGCANLSGGERVTRGGGWQSAPGELRAAARFHAPPGEAAEDQGFRCARAL